MRPAGHVDARRENTRVGILRRVRSRGVRPRGPREQARARGGAHTRTGVV